MRSFGLKKQNDAVSWAWWECCTMEQHQHGVANVLLVLETFVKKPESYL